MNISVTWIFRAALYLPLGHLLLIGAAHAQEPISGHLRMLVRPTLDSVNVQKIQVTPKSVDDMTFPGRPHVLDMLVNIPKDWASAGQVSVSNDALPYIGGVGILTGLLIVTDRQTNEFSKRMMETSGTVRNASKFCVRMGDGKAHLALAAGFALYGLIDDDSRAIRTGSQTVEVLLACGITVQALKRISGRESPQAATSDRGVWHLFPNLRSYQQHQPRYYAFPSGHISTTMATVTVLAENYPEISWIRPVGYTLVGCLGVSLVNVGYHWYSDLPLGIALGYMFGMIASHRGDEHFVFLGNHPYSGLQLQPELTQERAGVRLALLF